MRKQRREEYAKLYEKWKQEQIQERILRSHMRNQRIRSRLANANEIELQRKLYVLRRWKELETRRLERMRQEHINAIRNKKTKINDYWRNKKKFQEDKIKRNKKIIDEYSKTQNINIALRMKFIQDEHTRMEELFYDIKSKDEKSTGLPKKKKKAIKDAVLNKFMKTRKESVQESDSNLDELLTHVLNKPEVEDIYKIVQGAKDKLERAVVVPDAVNYVIDVVLENSLRKFVKKQVTKIMDQVFNKAKDHILKSPSSLAKKSCSEYTSKKFSVDVYAVTSRILSKLAVDTYSLLEKPLSRGVSFGTVHTIGEVPTAADLRSIKDRLPTPV
ncbi:hypothetical protein L9F63_000931, partial [Diploptera punctata]